MPAWLDDAAKYFSGGAGIGGVIFAAKWGAEFIGGRMDKRADRLDADTRFVIDQLRTELTRVSEQADKRLSAAEAKIEDLEEQLHECRKEHAVSRAKAARLEAMLLATRPGLKRAFPPDDCIPKDMAVACAKLDGGGK